MNSTAEQITTQIKPSSMDELRRYEHLFRAHSQEAEPDLAPFYAFDWDTYRVCEEGGHLIVLAAWHGADLIGYVFAGVVRSPHYDRVFCQHDALYVVREWRARGVGVRLIRALADEAQRRGCHRIIMAAKPGSALHRLLPRLGFGTEETIFKRDLDDQETHSCRK